MCQSCSNLKRSGQGLRQIVKAKPPILRLLELYQKAHRGHCGYLWLRKQDKSVSHVKLYWLVVTTWGDRLPGGKAQLCQITEHQFSSVQFSHSVVSDSLRPHELQHARPPCPSPTPRVHSDSRPWSQWCHPAISSSVVPFSSCP